MSAELIHQVKELCGPLGPMGHWQAREAATTQFQQQLSEADIELLLSAVLRGVFDGDEKECLGLLLSAALAFRRQRQPQFALDVLQRFLHEPLAREIVLYALGGLSHPSGVALIRATSLRGDFLPEEYVAAACALGEIGTPEAAWLLREWSAEPPLDAAILRDEIQIALDACQDA